MKRVLIFSVAYFPLSGGAEVAVRELTSRMPGFSFEMVTAGIRPGLAKEEMIDGVLVHRVGIGHNIDKWLMPWLAANKADDLHRERPFDAIWVIMASYAGFAGARFKRMHPEVPMLLTLQEGDPLDEIEHKVRYVRSWFLDIFRRADGLQAISAFLRDWGLRLGFKGKISEVVPNGVPLAEFSKVFSTEQRHDTREEFGLKDEDFVVITTSRLVVKNGLDLVIAALVGLPERVKFLIVGTGPLESELRRMVELLGFHDRVVFAGAYPYEALPRLYAAADAFCRPSRTEGMGNSFIEAMAAGIPVVATPVGGIIDFARDGENCLLAKPEDAASVSEALRRLEGDAALRAKLSAGGRTTVAAYDWNDLAKRMSTIFETLTQHP